MARTFTYSNPQVKFPKAMWEKFIRTSIYVLKRIGKSSVNGVSPYELWMNKKTEIN